MKFASHAKRRMRQRNITEREVGEALDNVILEYPSKHGQDRTTLVGHTKAGRELKIIVATTDLIIITVMPTRV